MIHIYIQKYLNIIKIIFQSILSDSKISIIFILTDFSYSDVAACARQTMVPPPTSTAMNHLLVGKNALVSGKNRPLSLPSATATSKLRPTVLHSPKSRRERQGVTLHWKDAKRPKQRAGDAGGKCNQLSKNHWNKKQFLKKRRKDSKIFLKYF